MSEVTKIINLPFGGLVRKGRAVFGDPAVLEEKFKAWPPATNEAVELDLITVRTELDAHSCAFMELQQVIKEQRRHIVTIYWICAGLFLATCFSLALAAASLGKALTIADQAKIEASESTR